MASKNVLVVELNEFNYELIRATLKEYHFPTLSKIFNFPQTNYKTQDHYSSGYLEPWVQWVSIHTGVPSLVHGIKHLGDVPHLNVEQCWETLSRANITTGVWGLMNGERRTAKNNLFFLPDPWTFSEWATPKELNNLLKLPRYLAKHYQHLKKYQLIKNGFHLFSFIFRSGIAIPIIKQLFGLLSPLKRFGIRHFIFISFFEYVSALLFIQYKKKYNPQCTYLFLNTLAHIQHHYWRKGTETATPEIVFGLTYLDKLFAQLLKAFPNDAIVVHNGLSQMNTNHEKPWVLYRQKDPANFLKALEIPALRVEQHMTHDGHVFFRNKEDCEKAFELLSQTTLNTEPLFHVEKNTSDPCKLFYMLKFTDDLDPLSPTVFMFNERKYNFFEYFDKIVTRTGRHIPIGKIFSNTISFPNHMQNHDFNKYIFHYLSPTQFPLTQTHEKNKLEELECDAV